MKKGSKANQVSREKQDAHLPAIGETIFTIGDGNREDVWDDTELIAHWDKEVDKYRAMFTKEKDSPPPFGNSKTKEKRQKKIIKPIEKKKIKKRVNPETSSNRMPPNILKGVPTTPMSTPPCVAAHSEQNKDEDLTSLLMSWYYCGYYTGLYQVC
ncbi:hypothetical protein J3Q64DRAFT_1198236 [Phycomyces blakesleeanus]|uniref:Survival Motor Neuron Gemin2-binding domain-containing protein n=2 Tax=Phycomyces blakesleeanus TaxID=4837 RepID=A0A167L161_PHYB8|nr:hypothetical protein PHYBLDRAFT_172607 [Phycomyces blakesleeanus NRRL 1555(-)]OAD69356.1 hypothetical protein PHYBLDRAFT_172607 [Phycomyces blakesleeanus NRRL 1555(-)]|eukprot:XP_018287396.1 hypothetical protein PHYBLDRAFT_172607 [Phycomyces blakesleeanus NRRL 1555(-)]